MKIVNRGYLIVAPKQPFFDWANEFEEEIFFDEEDEVEPTIYLIEEDFIETEQVIRDHFKKIFLTELNMITENTDDHPKISEALFFEWFTVIAGTTVIDADSADLKRFDLD